jgi:hypothetical protein
MQERIADYVLGALDEHASRQVREHVSECRPCQEYLEALTAQGEGLAGLGRQVEAEMEARQAKVLQALEETSVTYHAGWVAPRIGALARIAVAAVLALGVGIAVGRLTAPRPIDVGQLRADLEVSIAGALRSTVEQETLAVVDERLQMALEAGNAELKAELGAQVRQDLDAFATQFVAGSEAMVDQRLAELVQLIEAARLKDRQRVARAFEQIEQSRHRDRTQIGRGFQTLATRTAAIEN